MGTGKLLRSFLFIVQEAGRGVSLIESTYLDTSSIEHAFRELLEKVSLFLSVKQMSCMFQTLVKHLDQGDEGDVGFFRGLFKSFSVSRVRKMLIDRDAKLHATEVCPYCKAKLWNMLQANMVPRTAFSRLGAYEDSVEYYVCLNGHMLGRCTLLPLSDSEEASEVE
ncbi:EID1-like F-box protein 2 [Iris pallida]|uniref:EID1-like F-box protein 2 n=1 Tax=Iris pallida TaxID=29817 RepID=A0AAX6HW12_IRIPA|nr:EID1-like F-box protein 2 [Iris pallida]